VYELFGQISSQRQFDRFCWKHAVTHCCQVRISTNLDTTASFPFNFFGMRIDWALCEIGQLIPWLWWKRPICRSGRRECVSILLAAKADATIPANDGLTCLHWLAANGRIELLEEFLKLGVEVNARDKNGQVRNAFPQKKKKTEKTKTSFIAIIIYLLLSNLRPAITLAHRFINHANLCTDSNPCVRSKRTHKIGCNAHCPWRRPHCH
jgi:hypothetical protein